MNLLEINDKSLVSKTDLSRKLTIGGITKAYPVYRIKLDLLFYNDQNDRIATWITQYKNNESNKLFSELNREEYNKVIEKFIIDSNPGAIEKTKTNISMVNQREPGVVLTDGRIIDGNRRFTCLRLLSQEDEEFQYFETVILESSNEADKKRIKMLELYIQHGEEQRIDYNQIDMAIGAYHDIVETKLLTIDEYVSSTNIPAAEVRRKLETAKLIIEFLEFMNVPEQYHIAREMQVYSVFYEMVPLLKRCDSEEEKEELKKSVFSNTMMKTFDDQKKYIRNVKAMMDSGIYSSYMKKQNKIAERLEEKKKESNISNKEELIRFVKENEDFAEELEISMETSLSKSKKSQAKNRPAQLLDKSISNLMDIDTRIFDKLSDTEKGNLQSQLSRLTKTVSLIQEEVVSEDNPEEETVVEDKSKKAVSKRIFIAPKRKSEPLVFCCSDITITNLSFSLDFSAVKYNDEQSDELDCYAYFVNADYEEISSLKEVHIVAGEKTKVLFTLADSASSLDKCLLVIKSLLDKTDEAQQLIEFNIKCAFSVFFDF